jgi:hypothetical protein
MSPIPLGILAASGSAAPAFQLLESTILGSQQSAVEFTDLVSKYASTYRHLQIRLVARGSTTSSNLVFGRFNGDSGNNYASHTFTATAGTVASNNYLTRANFYAAGITRSNAPVGAYAVATIDIMDAFSTTKFTTTKTIVGIHPSLTQVGVYSGLWVNAAALNVIRLFPDNGNFMDQSRFSLYGIRG